MVKYIFIILLALLSCQKKQFPESADLPQRYDLRKEGIIPGVREQSWGTCWAFATSLSLETNLMKTKEWSKHEKGPAHLAPYYMDKYSGFTRKGDDEHVNETWYSGQGRNYKGSNSDEYNSGLVVHLGGDFKTATAFLSNTKGLPQARLTPTIPRGGDHKLFGDLSTEGILKDHLEYNFFFPRNIIWLTLHGDEDSKRRRIKEAIMKFGAVASAQVKEDNPLAKAEDGLPIHASLDKKEKLNHAINLIGWDDKVEWEGHIGAWIAQDSDHRTAEDKPQGHFYVLYDDVYAAKDAWMGGVSFRDVSLSPFENIYSHSLHGFRYKTQKKDSIRKVANVYKAKKNHSLQGVGFYTMGEDTHFELKFMQGGELGTLEGKFSEPGFHYISLKDRNWKWKEGENLSVELSLSDGIYTYDASSTIQVLLGAPLPKWGTPIEIRSAAHTGQSFFWDERNQRKDFSTFISRYNQQIKHPHAVKNPTANITLNIYTD